MTRTETITMTMKEADRLKTIQAVIDGDLTARLAANRSLVAVSRTMYCT